MCRLMLNASMSLAGWPSGAAMKVAICFLFPELVRNILERACTGKDPCTNAIFSLRAPTNMQVIRLINLMTPFTWQEY